MWKNSKNSKNKRFSRPGIHHMRVAAMVTLIASLIGVAAGLPVAANASSRTPHLQQSFVLAAPAHFVTSSSGTVKAPAATSCPRPSLMTDHSGTVKAKNYLNNVLFKTTLHVVWCYKNGQFGKVTRIIKITVSPGLTNLGAVGGWKYLGLVSGTSDGYYYNSSGVPHSGYHVFREAHWQDCILHYGCVRDAYIKMNMNVFYNGTARFYTGSDHL